MTDLNRLILFPIPLSEFEEIIREIVRSELKNFAQLKIEAEVELITRKEAAKILGVSLPTLARWSKEGFVKSYRISSKIRYKRFEVIDSLKARKFSRHNP